MPWSVRGPGGLREGLTIYQVQEMLRTRQLGPGDEAAQDGAWLRIADHPALARYLPEATPPPPKPGDVVTVSGVALKLGPDGKPMLPDAAMMAQLLGSDSGQRERLAQRMKVFRVLIAIILMVTIAGCVMLFLRLNSLPEMQR